MDDKEVDLSALGEKLRTLLDKSGLWREDLAYVLGPGLREMWQINEFATFEEIQDLVFSKFEAAIASLSSAGESDLKLATRISYNMAPELTGLSEVKGLGKRQEWLNEQHHRRDVDSRELPTNITRNYCRRYVPKVAVPHLQRVFGAEWKQFAPGREFPSDSIVNAPSGSQDVIPQEILSSAITDLLRAQVAAARNLPYWPDDTTRPALQDVYVPISLKLGNASSHNTISMDTALACHQHLLITGEPGTGKSTLAIQTVAQASNQIINNRAIMDNNAWIPLYIPAPIDRTLSPVARRNCVGHKSSTWRKSHKYSARTSIFRKSSWG